MTLCPIAIVAGCKKCPVFKICPLKGIIGDSPSTSVVKAATVAKAVKARPAAKPRKAAARRKK